MCPHQLQEELESRVQAWEQEHEDAFLVKGQQFMEYVAEQWQLYRMEKEKEKQERVSAELNVLSWPQGASSGSRLSVAQPCSGGENCPSLGLPICCWQLPRETGVFSSCWLCTWSPSLLGLVSPAVCVLSLFLGPSCARTLAWLWLPVNLPQSTCFWLQGCCPPSEACLSPGTGQ